ncbi:fatty acid biosynthesis 1 [Actinidia rufa]|uniref:beta-ketoacyl-[acyl-carrier-protein] synthase I n=1 Tax=Actinidia rufa TaxID=165716 RepID=A0A7J0FIN7_9ERIC|nr:fatty acid biosynthesis 1 [Actinidia rufa]
MVASSVVCSWLVAACMSIACEKDQPMMNSSSMLQSSPAKRWSRWSRKRRLSSAQCRADLSKGLVSSFCGSGNRIQGLMSSYLAFEPCDEYYSSKGVCSSDFFGDNGFASLFGSKNVMVGRRRRRVNRAVHSGMGVESPVGHDPDVFYNNLLEGVSGISEIEAFDCAQYPTVCILVDDLSCFIKRLLNEILIADFLTQRIAGEIKSFSTDGWVAPKLSKRMDKFMVYMLTAGKKALADGGITEDVMNEIDKARCGVLIGSAMGGMKVFNDAIEALRISYRKMNPFCVPFATTNMGSAMLAMDLDMMLCGGSDAVIIPIGLGGFVACRALSQRNSDPAKASRPWDINRDGFVMGEGAGVLLLEELDHAKKRGANIYAEFLGGSFTCDAYHMTEPHPEGTGVVLCIEKALAQSGASREDVNYINAHATSTPAGDLKEYQALIRCFGQNPELRVNSTKSMIGHLLGAAGAVEAVATVQSSSLRCLKMDTELGIKADKAIRTGWVHPNINLENPDEGVDMNVLVGPRKERLDIKVALSNSFGFGGHNSSILFAPSK